MHPRNPKTTASNCRGLPFKNVLADVGGARWYTNAEFYAAMSPVNGSLPYVYDKLLSWPGCSGGTLVDWVDARNGTNATASNVTSSSTASHPEMKGSSSTTEAVHPSGARRR